MWVLFGDSYICTIMRQFSKAQLSVGYLFNSYWFWTTACNEERYEERQEMAVGSLHLFEHESTKGSCMYLGLVKIQ